MRIKDVSQALLGFAPTNYQEHYDNTGLLIGNPEAAFLGALCCHDLNDDIIDEALLKNCNLIVCHHPPIFDSIKSVLKSSSQSGLIYRCISEKLSVYSTHTALDNSKHGGNSLTANKLGLLKTTVLKPMHNTLFKLYTFCPSEHIELVKEAVFSAGAGNIGNYSECSFEHEGLGNFKANAGANPFVGEHGKRHHEVEKKLEFVFEDKNRSAIINALLTAHPYEEVAYDVVALENEYPMAGSGIIGEFPETISKSRFLELLKEKLQVPCIKYCEGKSEQVKKVAICGGSGSFLISEAMRKGADAFVSGDIGYHRFFDAKEKLLVCDVGHFESEQFVKEVVYGFLKENFANFAVHLAETDTNPVKYF